MAVDRRATRLGVLAVVGLMLFGVVGARLWFLQTVKADELQAEVDTTKLRTVPLLPERGRIFDADRRILADNERVDGNRPCSGNDNRIQVDLVQAIAERVDHD